MAGTGGRQRAQQGTLDVQTRLWYEFASIYLDVCQGKWYLILLLLACRGLPTVPAVGAPPARCERAASAVCNQPDAICLALSILQSLDTITHTARCCIWPLIVRAPKTGPSCRAQRHRCRRSPHSYTPVAFPRLCRNLGRHYSYACSSTGLAGPSLQASEGNRPAGYAQQRTGMELLEGVLQKRGETLARFRCCLQPLPPGCRRRLLAPAHRLPPRSTLPPP